MSYFVRDSSIVLDSYKFKCIIIYSIMIFPIVHDMSYLSVVHK